MVVEQGKPMLASDILNLTFFPVGSILMMDGSWQDGRGGWYICDGRDTPHGQTPDLKGIFIRGGTSSGVTGGSNASLNISLDASNLPSHKHGIKDVTHTHDQNPHTHSQQPHTHTQDSHNHTQNPHRHTDSGHSHTLPYYVPNYDGYRNGNISLDDSCGPKFNYTNSGTANIQNTTATNIAVTATNRDATATNNDATAVNKIASTGITETEYTGSGAPITLSAVPAYYTVIYIKKMA
jgi:hypothetical protein